MNELEGLFTKELKDKCVRRVQGPTASMFAHLDLGHRGGAAACGGLGTISPPLKTRVCLACDVIWESAKDQNEFILD